MVEEFTYKIEILQKELMEEEKEDDESTMDTYLRTMATAGGRCRCSV